MIRRRALLAGAAALAAASRGARAERGITLLVGAPEGANADLTARAFVPFLERHMPGAAVAVRNLPGESGLLAYRALAEAPQDGATLGWVTTPSLPARCVDRADPGLLERLRLVGALQREPVAIVAPARVGAETVPELLRRSAAEREAVPIGTPPSGSPAHLAALQLQDAARMPLNLVAFPSSAAARQAVLAGNLAAAALGLGDALAGLRDGRLVALGLAAESRSESFPDVPVLAEAGIAVATTIRRGLAAPAPLPAEAEARLVTALRAVAADPEFAAEADQDGFFVAWLDGPGWTQAAAEERAALVALWARDPWLPTGAG